MAYELEAVIGLEPAVRFAARGWEAATVVTVGAGLAIIPITDRLSGDMEARFGSKADEAFLGVPTNVPATARWLREASKSAFLAFIGAEFFGGIGSQWAVGMEGGQVVLGPMETSDAINQVLRRLGVKPADGKDEFDTVELGRHRRTARWAGEEP